MSDLTKQLRPFVQLLTLNISLHLLLDTWAGDIWWLYPFDTDPVALITVPATQSNWVLSFILHWSFIPELVIIGIAGITLLRYRKSI